MADPFESLRHDAESTGSTTIDPRFRAELLAEARHRLEGTATSPARERVTADTPTPIPMETLAMTDKRPNRTRTYLLAAASLAIIVAGIVAILATNQADDTPPAAQSTPAPPTAAPPSTSTTSTTSTTTTTTVVTVGETDIAEAILLSGEEYGPDWTVVPNASLGASIDSSVAAEIPECAPFVESVFAAAEQGSGVYRSFYHVEPPALFTQYVAVLPDAETARAVYDVVNSAEFTPCATAYGTTLSPGSAPVGFPSPVEQPITDAPFESIGDAMTFRTFPETWYDENGVAHGPSTDVDAVLLVDRTITFIGTVTEGEGGAVLNTNDQFRAALERVVERTNAALAGRPVT